VLFWYKS